MDGSAHSGRDLDLVIVDYGQEETGYIEQCPVFESDKMPDWFLARD